MVDAGVAVVTTSPGGEAEWYRGDGHLVGWEERERWLTA